VAVCRRIVLIALSILLAGASASGVDEGLVLFERLRYDRAVVVLQRALTEPDLSKHDRRRGLEGLAFAYVVLEDRVNATKAFHRLLDLDPDYQMPAHRSPRLVRAFEDAVASWHPTTALEVDVADDTVRITVRGATPHRLALGAADGSQVELRCEARACAAVRPPASFHVHALAEDGSTIATAGPYAASGAGPPWWIWVGVGAAVVAGGVTAAVLLTRDDAPPEGDLGRLALP